jgi:hypothetical protein
MSGIPDRSVLCTAALVLFSASGFGQSGPVQIIQPADLVLQPQGGPLHAGTAEVRLAIAPGIARLNVWLGGMFTDHENASGTWLPIGPCYSKLRDLPGEKVPLVYEAYDASGVRVARETQTFTLGPDTTKPVTRITPVKGNPVVRHGEHAEFVITGEEDREATSWQTGIRRLTLADPDARVTLPISDKPDACDRKPWKGRETFSYSVPQNAHAGQTIPLTAAAEDWAGNIGVAPLDLIVQEGYAGVWTTKGRFVGRNTELSFSVTAVFSFMLNERSGAVMCGTPPDLSCGSARVTYDPGHAGKCSVLRNPSSGVFRIRVTGVRQGNKLAFLTMVPVEHTRAEYRFACPGGQSNAAGFSDAPVGSIQPEGLTITIPIQDHVTFVKSEAAIPNSSGYEVEHRVEIYAPRGN